MAGDSSQTDLEALESRRRTLEKQLYGLVLAYLLILAVYVLMFLLKSWMPKLGGLIPMLLLLFPCLSTFSALQEVKRAIKIRQAQINDKK